MTDWQVALAFSIVAFLLARTAIRGIRRARWEAEDDAKYSKLLDDIRGRRS